MTYKIDPHSMKTQTFRVAYTQNANWFPDNAKADYYEKMKQEIGNKLFDLLEGTMHPAVIEISDLIITQERDNNPLNTLTYETMSIEVKITPVKYRNVEWMKETKFSSIPVLLSPPTTFIKKLKFLFGKDNAY